MEQERLVQGLRRQEPEAVQELMVSCGDRLFRSACLLCGDPAEAQDLVQETLLQAIHSAPRFSGRSSLYTWLHGILLNLTRHYHRDRKRLVFDDALARQERAEAEEKPSGLDAAASFNALADALQTLSPPHREVLVLRYYEDLKLQDIAERLGVSAGTVKSRLHYAVAELQKRLPAEMNLFGAVGTQERTSQ